MFFDFPESERPAGRARLLSIGKPQRSLDRLEARLVAQEIHLTYDKLGRHAEAQEELAKLKAVFGDTAAYQYAFIHAQWGDHAKALESLDTAMSPRDTGLGNLKTDPLTASIVSDSRIKAFCPAKYHNFRITP